MKVRTDFHSVNLTTGERTRSVVGDGERHDEVVGPYPFTEKPASKSSSTVLQNCMGCPCHQFYQLEGCECPCHR